MAKKTNEFDYGKKAAELDEILRSLQDPNIQLDEAAKLHKTGLELIGELETYLKQAENEVTKHTASQA